LCSTVQAQERAFIRNSEKTFMATPWSYKELKQRQIVMQQLDYSCGAASLATVIRYYWGDDIDEAYFLSRLPKLNLTVEQMKDRIENGLTLTDLRDLATMAGYEASMGKLTFPELTAAKVPLIVGVTVRGHDHFVVFRGWDGYFVYLADPIRGNIRTPANDFVSQWQKNAILAIAKPNTPIKTVNPLAVKQSEADRGWLNRQYVRKNPLGPITPSPNSTFP